MDLDQSLFLDSRQLIAVPVVEKLYVSSPPVVRVNRLEINPLTNDKRWVRATLKASSFERHNLPLHFVCSAANTFLPRVGSKLNHDAMERFYRRRSDLLPSRCSAQQTLLQMTLAEACLAIYQFAIWCELLELSGPVAMAQYKLAQQTLDSWRQLAPQLIRRYLSLFPEEFASHLEPRSTQAEEEDLPF